MKWSKKMKKNWKQQYAIRLRSIVWAVRMRVLILFLSLKKDKRIGKTHDFQWVFCFTWTTTTTTTYTHMQREQEYERRLARF